MIEISVIIVSYNAPVYLAQCLNSCNSALKNYNHEIIVVDNNSPDRTIEILAKKYGENIKFFLLKENLGFGKANNFGVNQANGKYVLILNPDMIISENTFENLLDFSKNHQNIGAVGIRLIDADGNFHPESKRNIPSLYNSFSKLFNASFLLKKKKFQYYNEDISEFEVGETEILVGAFMWTEKSKYLEIGGFDQSYFMYGEDIDFSYSLILKNYKNYYLGDTTAIHYKGESTKTDVVYLENFYGAMGIFMRKYFKEKPFQRLIIKFGLSLKFQFAKLKLSTKNKEISMHHKSEIEWLDNEKSITNQSNIGLDSQRFSYAEIIAIINQYHSRGRKFYIKTQSDQIISSEGIIQA